MGNIIKKKAYLARFFDAIREKRKILFLGTSESTSSWNIAAQLNFLAPDKLQMVAIAKAGISPIHSALVIAKAKREGIQIPPIVLVINPVYFTQAYDLINDGWMSAIVRSPVFIQMNHRDVRDYLSEEVRGVYDEHFALRRALYPATVQEYLGNLIYLSFHQLGVELERPAPLPIPVYRFDGSLPNYDEERNVWAGQQAADRLAKGRWLVNKGEDSANLKGLASIMTILRKEPAPVLLLVLPVNRKFYEYHGLDMAQFDLRYRAIRDEIQALAHGENTYLIDLYDAPKFRFGFEDRMHMDQYGFFQVTVHILKTEAYHRFVEAVKSYYAAPPSSAQTAARLGSCCPAAN